jgi:hypothetical protein
MEGWSFCENPRQEELKGALLFYTNANFVPMAESDEQANTAGCQRQPAVFVSCSKPSADHA